MLLISVLFHVTTYAAGAIDQREQNKKAKTKQDLNQLNDMATNCYIFYVTQALHLNTLLFVDCTESARHHFP